jgi:lipoprotein-releasing system permease protein
MTATAPSLPETHTPRRRVAALERRIAVRYLKGRKSSGLASLSTMIATGGVVVGVAALLVVLGVMNGLRDDLREKILVGNPHLHLLTYGANLRMDHWREVLEKVRKDPEVVAASPGVLVKSLALNNANYPAAVDVVGLDPDTTKGSATALPKAITQGDLSFRTRSDSVEGGVILGYRLADRLSTYVGDQLTLLSAADARVNRALGRPTPRFWRFEVTGIFNTGMYEYDDGFAVMRLDQAQRFAGLGNAVSGIQIRLKDPWRAREVGKRLEDSLGYPYRSLAWQDQNATLFGALQLEKLGMGLIICFIMLVAAFNIVGTLTMVVTDKTREIGILLAMGLTPRSISRIFRAQGAVIGVVGTALGLGLGLLLAYLIDTSGIIRINPEIYFIDHLPVHIQVFDVLAVAAISLLVALLATLPASRSAARLQPVDAIRHE